MMTDYKLMMGLSWINDLFYTSLSFGITSNGFDFCSYICYLPFAILLYFLEFLRSVYSQNVPLSVEYCT